jgi:hypothetical protein
MAGHLEAVKPKDGRFFQALLEEEDFQSCDSFRFHVGRAAILLKGTNVSLFGLPESTRTSRIAI